METTLNAGTMMMTLYSNFNMLLKDKVLMDTLEIQVKIVGDILKSGEYMATLYYQVVYIIL